MDNAIVRKWREQTAKYLKETYPTHTFSGQVIAHYTFFVKDARGRDCDNMVSSVNDALVKAGIIVDDKWQILRCSGYEASIDRENPRAEITLFPAEWSIE